jgi:hypothetical protein
MTDSTEQVSSIAIGQVLFVAEEPGTTEAVFGPALVDAAFEAARFLDIPGGWQPPVKTGSAGARVRPELTLRYVGLSPPAEVADRTVPGSIDYVRAIRERAQAGPGLYQQQVLGPLASRVAEIHTSSVVLTDLPITPPKEWRYIIWDVTASGAVISAAPLDPGYWEPSVPPDLRRATITRRATAAQLCVMGSLLGLRRCDNDRCFMFGNIDSVTRLDHAETIGPEHGIEELTSRRLQPMVR